MPHTLGTFDTALQSARTSVLTMASITQENLSNAIHGLLDRQKELCSDAIADDEDVNNFERSIDREGLEILMRFNPVATDLRNVLATMKIASNLERIADQAENIARRARKIIKNPEVPEARMIEPMFAMASDLLADAIRAFSEGDAELALSLYDRDQVLDKLHAKTIKGLTAMMEDDQENLKTYLNLIFITRSLERVGDHAVNIGEDTVFVEKATDIRHVGPAALEE